jgi:hypothetical protein
MVRVAVSIAGLAMLLAGCAGEGPQAPSFAGLSSLAHSEEYDSEQDQAPSKAVTHVQSNKVLGAMAFQKATGRTVDPSRLSGRN